MFPWLIESQHRKSLRKYEATAKHLDFVLSKHKCSNCTKLTNHFFCVSCWIGFQKHDQPLRQHKRQSLQLIVLITLRRKRAKETEKQQRTRNAFDESISTKLSWFDCIVSWKLLSWEFIFLSDLSFILLFSFMHAWNWKCDPFKCHLILASISEWYQRDKEKEIERKLTRKKNINVYSARNAIGEIIDIKLWKINANAVDLIDPF